MSHIVESLRKHQKMIVLGAAIGVIALYIMPLDQISNAISADRLTGIDNAIQHIQDTQQRISDKDFKNSYKIVEHLNDVISHLSDVKYRLLNT